jgi:hypothetical protein
MIRLRKPVVFLVVVAAAVCCSISTANAVNKPHQPVPKQAVAPALQYAGTLEGSEEFYTPQDAEAKVQQALNTNENTILVRVLWDYTALPPSINTTEVCNLAHAAEKYGLKAIILSLEPTQTVWPLIKPDMDWFLDNIRAYDRMLFDPVNKSDCLSDHSQLQIMWSIGNEPNVHYVCDGSDKDPKTRPVGGMLAEHQACATRMALLYHASYKAIRDEKTKYGVDLKVIVGNLSSNDAPLDQMAKYFQARQDLGYPPCGDMDYFGFHPYPLGESNGPNYGFNLFPKLVKLWKSHNCTVSIFYTEMGFTTKPPADGSRPCTYFEGAFLSEEQAAQTLNNAVAMSLSQGVIGVINFKLNDEKCRQGGWSSGFYYSNGDPKPFLDQVRNIFQNALNPQRRAASSPNPEIRPLKMFRQPGPRTVRGPGATP